MIDPNNMAAYLANLDQQKISKALYVRLIRRQMFLEAIIRVDFLDLFRVKKHIGVQIMRNDFGNKTL